ncbi:hypothetical protein SOVF_172330 isoform C [Spinacia oleracea]|nr:hypothetical protein SOVF_172330 isoform C [Spinacia oleracea]
MLSVGLNTQLPSITLLKFRQATSGVSICIWYFTAANQVRKCLNRHLNHLRYFAGMFLGQIISPDKGIKLKTVVCGWPVGNLAYDSAIVQLNFNLLQRHRSRGMSNRRTSATFEAVYKGDKGVGDNMDSLIDAGLESPSGIGVDQSPNGRYLKTAPRATELLDVRRDQKLEMVKEFE